MPTRRAIKGVLQSFLGTYVSRYSDFRGYLLFGFLVCEHDSLTIDLLGTEMADAFTPREVAISLAIRKFAEQLRKVGLRRDQLSAASLTMCKLSGNAKGTINRRTCNGFDVQFIARAAMDNGRKYERKVEVFIAPHNASIEFCSVRWGFRGWARMLFMRMRRLVRNA